MGLKNKVVKILTVVMAAQMVAPVAYTNTDLNRANKFDKHTENFLGRKIGDKDDDGVSDDLSKYAKKVYKCHKHSNKCCDLSIMPLDKTLFDASKSKGFAFKEAPMSCYRYQHDKSATGSTNDQYFKQDQLSQVKNYCEYIQISDRSCNFQRNSTWMYEILTAVCATECSGVVTSYGIGCTAGQLTMAIRDSIFKRRLKAKTEQYKQEFEDQAHDMATKKPHGLWKFATTLASNNYVNMSLNAGLTGGLMLGFKSADLAPSGACLGSVLAGIQAIRAGQVRRQISSATMSNLAATQEIYVPPSTGNNPNITPVKPTTLTPSNGGMASNGTTGNSDSAVEYDTSGLPDHSSAIQNDNAATDAMRDIFGKDIGPDDINRALGALQKAGIDPAEFLANSEQNGLGSALTSAMGDKAANIAGALKDMEDMIAKEPVASAALAYDASKSAGGGSAKKEAANPFGELFGNRGPASGDGGLKEIKFGGVNGNDIWHTGTNMSIFEIVNKKTVEVTGRVVGE